MRETTIWIILATVLGFFLLALALTLGLFLWKRSKKRIRVFSIRAVTPLDDSEFESWRRPSTYTKRPDRYGIKPQPAVTRPRSPNIWEKELGLYDPDRTTPRSSAKIANDLTSPIRKPQKARRKSSTVSSIADRPPTPYSPSTKSGEFPHRESRGSHRSRDSHRHIHYPSMSEVSEFNFIFDEFDQPRLSSQSERRLYSDPRHLENA